ncbi:ABC transporter permease [Trebonia sp.]|uniref:ABC transporter permease n=1 Tax=Trebonia sp. TaxID=2767075 RepID=UPI00260D2C66|nr:ABC transporter permease [Trebonia sp.]
MSQPQAATPAPEKPGSAGKPGASVQAILRARPAEFLGRAREGGIIYPFILLFIVLSAWQGSLFYGKTNLLEILDQQSSTVIIAAAGTMVLIAGGIDLSVGATYALCQVIATKMAETGNPVIAIIVGVLVGIGVGAINGVIATFFRINSLIATLAMSFVITGVASLVTNGNLIYAGTALGYANFARTEFLDVTTATWTMIGVVIILGIVLSRTIAGRYMYAAGSNAEAARLAGVRVQWIKLVTFAISGGAAGLGGIIDASRVLSASSAYGGPSLTFTVLAGIVVGGTSILGGQGAIWRTVIGTLFIAIIYNGFTLLGWNPLYEPITVGLILLLAVGGDAWSRLRTS